jgi:NTP pyrophosphatase (non-canonical NTP hydrolase)
MDIAQIQARLEVFATERDWGQFHSVRNLVFALVGEAGEIAELFQWIDDSKVSTFLDEGGRERLGEELADVLFYLVRLADKAGVDLDQAVSKKLELNAVKYPVNKSRGVSTKYVDL